MTLYMWQAHDIALASCWEFARELQSQIDYMNERVSERMRARYDPTEGRILKGYREELSEATDLVQHTWELYEWERNEGKLSRPSHPWDTQPASQSKYAKALGVKGELPVSPMRGVAQLERLLVKASEQLMRAQGNKAFVTNASARSSADSPRSEYRPSRLSAQTPQSPLQDPVACAKGPQTLTQTPRTSAQTPHSPTRTPRSPAQPQRSYNNTPRSSAQAPRSSTQTPRSSTQTPRSSTQIPRSSAQTPHSYNNTPRSSAQAPRSSTHTPRSSASAPIFPPHPLSPPPASTPYDQTAWNIHDALLRACLKKADILDFKAHLAEKRWKAVEASLPFSRKHEAGVFEKIPTLQEINSLVWRVRTLGRRDRKWRRDWLPRSPYLRYPAWGSVYAEAVGVLEGAGVVPWDVVVEFEGRLDELLERVGEM
ncbi:hypothetical protein BDW02DRAFT_646510 [Decorospora gaudefroyi]|uniref:Uncharacterized protein n=1 Tax=Decorospora gaudefroyi TaxID=184978 RepID=A0A6A5KK03_9PLEO|nr:hypothetical protein BDW02DRAFT_646510 [Decorospora gaudefroyi]